MSILCFSFPHSNKGMDHLSTMKRKNVVLVYDLLLEMLDANTPSSCSQTASSSPSSDSFSDQQQYPPPPPGSDQTFAPSLADEAPPAPPQGADEGQILDRQQQAPPCRSMPPSHSLVESEIDE